MRTKKRTLISIMGLDKQGTYLRLCGYMLILMSLLFYTVQGIQPRRATLVACIGIVLIMIQEFVYLAREE